MKKYALKFIYWILAKYARKVIAIHKPYIIGVTGSVGKTSTKEAVYQVLADKFDCDVRKNYGNLNAEIGIPLTILGYEKVPSVLVWPIFLVAAYFRTFQPRYPKYLVMEMGVEHKGDIQYFATIARPDIAIITSVGGAHVSNFNNLADYQDEKLEIIKELKEGGKAILNFDDPTLVKLKGDNIISYSVDTDDTDFRAQEVKPSLSGTEFRIISLGQKIAVKSKVLGKQAVYSSLPAFAVGHLLGIQSLAIKHSLEQIAPINGRMRVIEGKNSTSLIDDTYNSNPTSARGALDIIGCIHHDGRKVAILGNMNELGHLEKAGHEEIGKYAKGKVDFAIFVGPNAARMQQAFGDDKNSMIFENRKELEESLSKIIRPKDLILIKASQNKNYFEEITKKLMQKPEFADTLLVRQSGFWRNKKR